MSDGTVDDLAQTIRVVDGSHSLGAGALAEAILASDWLAAEQERVRQEERERIAAAIEVPMRRHDGAQVGFSAVGDAYADAARIARQGGDRG